jgi:ParB family chromosome partitioning protein
MGTNMNLYKTKTENIIVPEDRVRKEFDKRKLAKLAESISKIGQILPGVCIDLGEGRFSLVAGERRLKACKLAQKEFTFVLEAEADPLLLQEIELEENLNREDLTWQEEVFGREKLHQLREEQAELSTGKKQTQEATGEELGVSQSTMQRDLELAQWAKEFDEVRNAASKKDAEKVIKRFKGNVLRGKALDEAIELGEESKAREEGADETKESIEIAGKEVDNEYILNLDRRIIHGIMEEKLESFKDGSIQLVLFDPPWGVDLDSVRKKGGGTEDFADHWAIFFDNIEAWLKLLERKMSENSHLYMFFGIANESEELEDPSLFLGPVYKALENVGFITNRMPLI